MMHRRIGVIGGTFDPIHYGHLFIAEEARVRYGLEQVLFVPNGLPPHKQSDAVACAADRFEMTRLATESNPCFACSDIEIARPGPSYTVDTLERIQATYPGSDLYYICGIDTAADLVNWHRPVDVLRLARFLAAARPGFDAHRLEAQMAPQYLERIEVMAETDVGISSTDIRARVREGGALRYLLPDAVLDYIERAGLYSAQVERSEEGIRKCRQVNDE